MRQNSHVKDTTDFINFVEVAIIPQDTILDSMDITSFYTNIPQDDGIQTVCNAYENFHNNNPPIPFHYLKQMLGLVLKENSFEFKGENYLQIQGTAMGTKMGVAFANIFRAEIKTNLLNQSKIKPIAWNVISMTFFPFETRKERTLIYS